jgi:hypothetical protein
MWFRMCGNTVALTAFSLFLVYREIPQKRRFRPWLFGYLMCTIRSSCVCVMDFIMTWHNKSQPLTVTQCPNEYVCEKMLLATRSGASPPRQSQSRKYRVGSQTWLRRTWKPQRVKTWIYWMNTGQVLGADGMASGERRVESEGVVFIVDW